MLIAVLTYLVVSAAADAAAQCTDCIKGPNSTCYQFTLLQNLDGNFREQTVIKKMAVLRSDNLLFYLYEPEISDPEFYKIAFLYLDNLQQNGTVHDADSPARNFATFDIDQSSNTLYLGNRDGVFTYKSGKIALDSYSGEEIRTLYFQDGLYVVKDNNSRRIEKKGDNGDSFNGAIDMNIKHFVITKEGVIVYIGTFGLFLKKEQETIELSKNAFFRGLSVDLDGVVYTWWIDEVYRIDINYIDLSKSRLVPVFSQISSLTSLTFDNDNNFLITAGKSLNRVVVSNATEC